MTRLAAVKGALVEHGRSIRAIVAVAVIVALAVLFVAQQADMTRTKERAMDRVSATSWKVSELVFETLRFSMALRLHATGEVKRADVEFSFELLWSRVDVVDNTAVGATEEMREILTRFRALLAAEEEAIFERPLIPPRVAVSLAEEMSGIARELRVIWLATFQNRSFAELTLRTLEDAGSERLQTLIVALMGLLVMYVIAEIIYAGVAQKREMRLRQAAAQASEAKTQAAAAKVKELRDDEGNPQLKLRVYITGGGCAGFSYGFTFDEAVNDDDTIVEKDGVTLLVDAMSIQYLDGSQVDYEKGLMGSRFVVSNPNAATTCGCGSSFSV
ncbi:iron-sulfur cluster insertion protein ErpA [Marinovum algicola]|uniref:iron-sulfur cluster insertion protein ErpA n=1 Tax=Marinovum algicola TaxID=42444 RepID=UPI0024BA722F|nr:iron-sulfur cluster insertion protein ErpA [Marinovum algicola]